MKRSLFWSYDLFFGVTNRHGVSSATIISPKKTEMFVLLLQFCLLFLHVYVSYSYMGAVVRKVSKGATIQNRYNQEPHLTYDTNGKVTNSQLDNTNESQQVSLFSAGDHKT